MPKVGTPEGLRFNKITSEFMSEFQCYGFKSHSIIEASTDVKTFFWSALIFSESSRTSAEVRTFFFWSALIFSMENRATVWHAEKFLS